jgi:hypothetical protein
MKLAKKAYKPELYSSFFFVSYLTFLLFFVIQLKFIYFNNALKKKGLYSKINNITSTTNLLIYNVLFNRLFFK